jgi:predicted Zn-dependent protease
MRWARKHTLTRGAALAALVALTAAVGGVRAGDGDDPKQTIQKLNSITGKEAIDAKVKELVKDSTQAEKTLKAADEAVKADPKVLKLNGAVILARTAYELKKYDVSLRYFKTCWDLAMKVQASQRLMEAFDGQYLSLLRLKKYEDAEKLCQKLLEVDDEEVEKVKPFIMEQMVQVKAQQGKIADALKLTDSLIKLDEGGWYFLQLKGYVLHEAGKYEDAVATYLDALKKLDSAEKPKAEDKERFGNRIRYILSGIYVETKQIDKAAEQLQILLKQKPDNPTFNNDLGFIWADNDQKLDESEKLIRKAIDEDRKERKKKKDQGELTEGEDHDHAAYLDSLGWVLFKKKQLPEAKKWLLEATKDPDEGQHVEILDHLADVHMALDEKNDAIAVWKKALEQDVSSKRDLQRQDDVRKKLKAAEGK